MRTFVGLAFPSLKLFFGVNAWMIRCVEDAKKRQTAKELPVGPIARAPGSLAKKAK